MSKACVYKLKQEIHKCVTLEKNVGQVSLFLNYDIFNLFFTNSVCLLLQKSLCTEMFVKRHGNIGYWNIKGVKGVEQNQKP